MPDLAAMRADAYWSIPPVVSFWPALSGWEDDGDSQMAEKREKTLSYRRAEWVQGTSGITLERCIREAHRKLPNIEARTIARADQLAKSLKQEDNPSGGLLLHLTVETPGEEAAVVPHTSATAAEVDLTVVAPPSDGEWLDGDAFLYVNGDHVCMCTTGVRAGAIAAFFYSLFEKAHLRKDSTRFLLLKVADMKKVKMLHKQGVRELEIRGTLYKATANHAKRKANYVGTLGAVGKIIKALLGKPHDVTPDGLRVYIGLRADRRFKKYLNVGYKTVEALSTDVVQNFKADDDYVIITKSGQRISQNEIFMRSKVQIDSQGKTVERDKAWKELTAFYDALKSSGVVEQ